MKLYRNQTLELLAEARLAELERLLGRPLAPPIPLDLIAERVLGLDFLWDEIEELPGEVILGGLLPAKRLIVLNARHQALFQAKPGLERSTKGHEMGHWDLFVDKARLSHPPLPGLDADSYLAYRASPLGPITVAPRSLLLDPDALDLIRALDARADHPAEARAVNRYAAALSMPRALIRDAALAADRTRWQGLYRLAERFDVTISALRVRLEQLDLLYVDPHGALHPSRAAAHGQIALW